MFETALEVLHDKNIKYDIDNIDSLGNVFNVRIYILRDNGNSYEIIKNSTNENGKNNKLYIVERNMYYDVLGYTKNDYDIFIF
jgi:hypothetical protein